MLSNKKSFFDIPSGIIYLDSAANSPLTSLSFNEGHKGLIRKYHPWELDLREPPKETESLRVSFSNILGVCSSNVAIINSTSYGIETAAKNLIVEREKKIIVLQDQFPSNFLTWKRKAVTSQAKLVIIPRPENYDWTTKVLEFLDKSVAIAALPPCHWTDGSFLDLSKIGKRCRELDIALVVDATQAIGAYPLDVEAIKPDFLICSAYKWLLCPYTLSFLYAAPKHHNGVPLELHRWNHQVPEGHTSNFFYPKELSQKASRYDMGEVNNYQSFPIALAGLKQIQKWGIINIHEYLSQLIQSVFEKALERGWSAPPEKHRIGHFIGINYYKPLPKGITERLKTEKKVFISHRGSGLRVSPHVFNSSEDIDKFFSALDQLLKSYGKIYKNR